MFGYIHLIEGDEILKYCLTGFIITILSTLLSVKLGYRFSLVDKPDSYLKPHKKPIPFTGGIALFTGFWISVFIFKNSFPMILFPLCFLLLITGFFDDIKGLNPVTRLSIEIIVGILLFIAGYKVKLFNFLLIDFLLTVFIFVGTLNAVNLIDGIDGLASGTSLIAYFGYGFLALIWNKPVVANIAYLLMTSLLGFFLFNFPRAKIFLGDEGSYILGFFLSFFFLSLVKDGGWDKFLIALLPLTIYFFDTGLAILRRAYHRKPIFVGDRSHFYDQLVERGIKPQIVTLILILMQTTFVIISLFLLELPIFMIIFSWIVIGLTLLVLIRVLHLVRA